MSMSPQDFLNLFDPARNGLNQSIADTNKAQQATDSYTRNVLNQQNQQTQKDLSAQSINGVITDVGSLAKTTSSQMSGILTGNIGSMLNGISSAFGISPQLMLLLGVGVGGYILVNLNKPSIKYY
jgi:hypothetical protein